MSASLVGSEMCIRDSSFPVAKRATNRLNMTTRRPYGFPADIRLTQESVSYTHLTLPTICSV
eukprot:11407756-Alexandrium_andersonii.AAC.1